VNWNDFCNVGKRYHGLSFFFVLRFYCLAPNRPAISKNQMLLEIRKNIFKIVKSDFWELAMNMPKKDA
jgi:hypothetical protein